MDARTVSSPNFFGLMGYYNFVSLWGYNSLRLFLPFSDEF